MDWAATFGLSLTSYGGKRDIYAGFTEVVVPLTKADRTERCTALRPLLGCWQRHHPKVGIKVEARAGSLALRGTYSGRLPCAVVAENSLGSIAAFSGATVTDNAAAPAWLACPEPPSMPNCKNVAPAFVQRGNPT